MLHVSDKKENRYVIKKTVNKEIKNREVCEGQHGVFGIRNNLTKIYIEKKLRSDPVAAFSAVAVSFLVFPLSFADSAARKRMFVSINVGLHQKNEQVLVRIHGIRHVHS